MTMHLLLISFMLIGMSLPLAGSFFNIDIYHYPFILQLFLSGIFIYKYPFKNLFLDKDLIKFITALCILLLVQIITDRGFVILSGGGYVILSACFFYIILCHAKIEINQIVRLFNSVYIVLLFFLVIEFVILSFGYQPLLVKILNSSASPGYKNYNPADLLQKIGLFARTENEREIGGLNSIYLGSQIAGMVSLFACIWFGFIKSITNNNILFYSKWYIFVFSCACLLITLNATVSIMIFLTFVIYINFINTKNRLIKNICISTFVLLFFLAITEGLIFSRIFSDSYRIFDHEAEFYRPYGLVDQIKKMSRIEFYAWMFYRPVDLWLTRDIFDQLFGVERNFLSNNKIFISGDFGFGADVLLRCGILWAIIYIWFNIKTVLQAFNNFREVTLNILNWQSLGATTGLISILWLASTLHYAQAFQNPGCIILYSLNLAVTFYCNRKINELNQQS